MALHSFVPRFQVEHQASSKSEQGQIAISTTWDGFWTLSDQGKLQRWKVSQAGSLRHSLLDLAIEGGKSGQIATILPNRRVMR